MPDLMDSSDSESEASSETPPPEETPVKIHPNATLSKTSMLDFMPRSPMRGRNQKRSSTVRLRQKERQRLLEELTERSPDDDCELQRQYGCQMQRCSTDSMGCGTRAPTTSDPEALGRTTEFIAAVSARRSTPATAGIDDVRKPGATNGMRTAGEATIGVPNTQRSRHKSW